MKNFTGTYYVMQLNNDKVIVSMKLYTQRHHSLYKTKITLYAGRGGNGCVSFRREKFLSKGGPDGGNGGNGGNIFLRSDRNMKDLIFFKYKKVFKADNGSSGSSNNKIGSNGNDLFVNVPVGTEIWHDNEKKYDFNQHNLLYKICHGGKGGLGNKAFATAESRAPAFATDGTAGTSVTANLILKHMTDIGLIGMPNAGKSTFLKTAVPNARVIIGEYAFSTLNPVLGTYHNGVVIADLPGLIAGAHTGRGRGHDFLQHIERCRALLFLFDISSTTLLQDIETIFYEVKSYKESLMEKYIAICLTKCDLCNTESKIAYLKQRYSYPIFTTSHDYDDTIKQCIDQLSDILIT